MSIAFDFSASSRRRPLSTLSTTSSLFDGETSAALQSIFGEIGILLIFFLTWTVVHRWWNTREVGKEHALTDEKKVNATQWRKSPGEAAQVIQDLCKDHFTKALRLYRELVKYDLDKHVSTEDFYLALVEGAVRVRKTDVAIQVLTRMRDNHVEASISFLQSVFRLLCARKFYQECLQVADLFELKADPVIYSCLTLAAGELGHLDLCQQYLQRSPHVVPADSKEYLPLMRAYARRKDWTSAVKAVRGLMERKMVVENVLFNSVLSSAGPNGDADEMHELFAEMRAYDPTAVDIVSYNSMMKCYARSGKVTKCFGILEQIHGNGIQPDDVTFSTLLDVCIDENEHQLAQVALDQMCSAGVQMNCVLLTTLMKGFIRSKRLDLAMNLYDSMRGNDTGPKPDMVTYSQLIKAHCDAQNMGRALDVFEDMLQCGSRVDDIVFTHLLEGCTHISNCDLAEKLFKDMLDAKIRPTIYTLTAMVKVYGKCGRSETAASLIASMEKIHGIRPTVVVYTCLISGLIRQKKIAAAFAAFRRMEAARLVPDAQCVTTMLAGLADAHMFADILDLVQRSHFSRVDKGLAEALNHALVAMVTRSEIAAGRSLYLIMVERKFEVTVPSIRRRLNLL